MRISDWSSDVCSSDLSPGLDFETKIIAKPEAAQLLRRELARKAYKPESIALGTNTDPYQPVESRLKITRSLLEVLKETRHPLDRKSVVEGKSESVRVDLGGRRIIKKKKKKQTENNN